MTPADRRGEHKRLQGAKTRDEIMAFLIEYFGTHGYAPTNQEIAYAIGVTSDTVTARLRELDKEGLIEKGQGSRAIVIKA